SMYNGDRNLLRMRERERRNQEALQDKRKLPEKTPLFPEPYKTNKDDELSSRIQNMLGNYEEAKEFMSSRIQQIFLGIPETVAPFSPQGEPDHPCFPERSSHALSSGFYSTPIQPPTLMGPMAVARPPPGLSNHYPKAQPRPEPASRLRTKSHSVSNGQSQGQERSRGDQESHADLPPKSSKRRAVDADANELAAFPLPFSPLLSSLSSLAAAPLSPLHSSQHSNSGPQNGSESHRQTDSQTTSSQDLVTESQEKETLDSSAADLTSTTQPSSQTFPTPLPPKTSAMQQKPTAYVRPMDGQEQAPEESPELKPLLEEYDGKAYEKLSDLKANSKAELSKLDIPSEPTEQTFPGAFPGDVHSIEDILKEMTHSWPPLLTAIRTPSTTEPSKFPFPAKESQHVGSVEQNHKQHDAPSETLPSSQLRSLMLQEDLHLSDSEESGDEQVAEKPQSSLAPPSALQFQLKNVASALCSGLESRSTSDSDSSSDSETESSSSDSEASEPPRTSAPEPESSTSKKWQLDNWLTKVNPPAVPPESLTEGTHGDGPEEDKEQELNNSVSSKSHQHAEPREPHHKTVSQVANAPQHSHLPTKQNCQKSPVHAEGPSARQTVGIKRPAKALVHEGSKRGLKVESEPSPLEVRDQSSRDKTKIRRKEKPESSSRKDQKLAARELSKNRKHKSSHQANTKPLDPKLRRDILLGGTQEHLALSPLPQGQDITSTRTIGQRPAIVAKEEVHKEKLPSLVKSSPTRPPLIVKIHLPLLSRVPQAPGKGHHQKTAEAKEHPEKRKWDLKRKTTDTPDKSPRKRKKKMEKEIDERKEMKSRNEKKSKKETKSLLSSADKDSSKAKSSKASLKTQEKSLQLPLPVSPAHAAPKSAKMAQKRPRSESSELPATDNTARDKSKPKDPLSSKHRKVERNHTELSKGIKGSAGDVLNTCPVPSLPNGTSKPRRPRLKMEKKQPAEYYIQEAKMLKNKADAMTDKTEKAFQYLDAVLSFTEYGIAMESDTPASKLAYGVFNNNLCLIRFLMKLIPFKDPSASSHEKIFGVLCMRCQAILQMAMFRHKKDTAMKYCRILNDHFKSSSGVTQAPSPPGTSSSGMPFPPTPSPASSVSSQPASACSDNSPGSSVTVPSNMPGITTSYINITSHVLSAYDVWEQANALARKNKGFFAELSKATCTLTLKSSMTKMVRYTRQGLHWLRLDTNKP
ncbi:AFF1 protein, partial [Bucco capensis]|nr:AFF1 protein [Bucco capensis]